jgi:hypothetical protein
VSSSGVAIGASVLYYISVFIGSSSTSFEISGLTGVYSSIMASVTSKTFFSTISLTILLTLGFGGPS